MNKILIPLLLLGLGFLIPNSLAYTPDIGVNELKSYDFADEFTLDYLDEYYADYTRTAHLTENTYTIAFLENTTIQGSFYFQAGEWFSGAPSGTYKTDVVYYSIIGGTSDMHDLTYTLIEISDESALSTAKDISVYADERDIAQFMDAYAIVIYDTIENIMKNTINYYRADIATSRYDDGYEAGMADSGDAYNIGYLAGYDFGFEEATNTLGAIDTTPYFNEGLQEMFDNGSLTNGYNETLSYDYLEGYDVGYDEGRKLNVNVATSTFMSDFDKWIVPAIAIVILLGGMVTVMANKYKRGE